MKLKARVMKLRINGEGLFLSNFLQGSLIKINKCFCFENITILGTHIDQGSDSRLHNILFTTIPEAAGTGRYGIY